MVDIESPTAEIRRGKKKKEEEEERNRMKIYMVSLLHRATINKSICIMPWDQKIESLMAMGIWAKCPSSHATINIKVLQETGGSNSTGEDPPPDSRGRVVCPKKR